METTKQAESIVKEISDNITAIKTKGEAQDAQLKALDAKIAANQWQLGDKYETLRNDFDQLSALLKRGRHFGGADRGMSIKDMLLAQREGLASLKNKAGMPVSLSLTARHLFTKAAGNVTEGGNLLGTDPLPPTRLVGVYADPLRPVHIRQFMNSTATDSNQILYNLLTGENDGSGSTAEGASATQSDFTITAKEVIVRKLNTYLTISKEMMEDADFVDNYINTHVAGRLLMLEDTQLISGNGIAPNLQGIAPVAAAYSNPVIPGATPSSINYYDVLHQAVTQARVAYYTPNFIVIHPNDYNALVLSRDSYGRYQFPQMISGAPGTFFISGAQIVANTAMPQGYFLVGDFELGATLAYRDEVNVTFSNQHVDNFVKGFITVLVEERLANVIYRPNAFVYGNFAQAEASGS